MEFLHYINTILVSITSAYLMLSMSAAGIISNNEALFTLHCDTCARIVCVSILGCDVAGVNTCVGVLCALYLEEVTIHNSALGILPVGVGDA